MSQYFCWDGSPVENDRRGDRRNKFQISMMETMGDSRTLPTCVCSFFLCPCFAYYARYRAIHQKMDDYRCCQGYFDELCCCFLPCPGFLRERNCPQFCLAMESCCCIGPSISSTRMLVMDEYDLVSDPCDNRIVKCSNCLQIMSLLFYCFCGKDSASIFVQYLAYVVFYLTFGCMTAQVLYEVDFQESDNCSMSVPILSEAQNRDYDSIGKDI